MTDMILMTTVNKRQFSYRFGQKLNIKATNEIYLNMILLRIFKVSDKDLLKTPGKKVTRSC